MIIKREIMPGVVLNIVLTEGEIEAAYREQEQNYHLQDARAHFQEMFGDWPKSFRQEYGVPLDAVIGPDGEYSYLLPEMVSAFEQGQDCNLDENSVWESAIYEVLEEHFKSSCPSTI